MKKENIQSENNETLKEKSTKDKIFEAAIELFSRNGFNGVSVRDITRKVGIKESSLYNHFKSKDQILESIFDYFEQQLEKSIPDEDAIDKAISSIPPNVFLQGMLEKFKEYADTAVMEKIYRIIIMEQFRDERAMNIRLRDMFRRPLEGAEVVFKKMAEKKLIKPINPKILALEYRYVIHSLTAEYNILKCYNMDTSEIDRQMSEHVKFIYDVIKIEAGG